MKLSTDTFGCISLDILKTDSLKAALASYTNSKDFEKYACKQCNKHVRANVKVSVAKVPSILMLPVKRFEAYTNKKINKKVDFASQLDVKPFSSSLHSFCVSRFGQSCSYL